MQDVYLSCSDIAKITNKKIRTVWNWCRTGKLRASKPGGRDYVIKESDFKAFCEGDQPSSTEKKE